MNISLRKSFIVYTLSNLFSRGLPFLLLPILTVCLTTEDYGILTNFTGLITILTPLVTVNFASAYSRQFFNESITLPSYLNHGILVQFVLAIGLFVLLFFVEGYLNRILGVDIILIRLTALYIFVFGLSELLLSHWRLENSVWKYAIFSVSRSILEIAITVLFVYYWNYDYIGRCIAIFGSVFLCGIPVLFLLNRLRLKKYLPTKEYYRHIFRFGAPLIPHAIAGTILSYSDKLIITEKLGFSENGIYSVAFQIGLGIGLVQNSFNQAWVPWFYQQLSQITENKKSKIVRISYLYYAFLIVLSVLLIYLTPYIYEFLGKDFKVKTSLVAWVAIGFAFNGFYKMKVNYLFYSEKTTIIGVLTIVFAILNIVLNLYLIDDYGIEGAAMATAITFFVQFIVVWIFAQRYIRMPWFSFWK